MRLFLILLGIYLTGDGLIHLTNIKLLSVLNSWPKSALSYANLLNGIYASFVFLVASLILVAQKDLKKYKDLIKVSGIWAIFHGILLIYLVYTQNFMNNFSSHASLHVWLPFYDYYLVFEAILAFLYALIAFLWGKRAGE